MSFHPSEQIDTNPAGLVGQPPTIHVLGGGPAGLSAALTIIRAGVKVSLIDDSGSPGGQIWRGGPKQWHDQRAIQLWEELRAHPNFTHIPNAQVIGSLGKKILLLEVDQQGVKIDFEKLIICSGAREIFLPFRGWTLPGVTGAGGLQALIKGGMSVEGRNVVIVGSGPLLLATAATAVDAGANVVAIIEHKKSTALFKFGLSLALQHWSKLRQAISLFSKLKGIPYVKGGQIVEARGSGKIASVVVRAGGSSQEYCCDFLAAGFGLTANTELAASLGCELADQAVKVDERQRTSERHIWAAGECTGIGGVDKALIEGRLAGLDALGLAPAKSVLYARRCSHLFAKQLQTSFQLDSTLKEMCSPETIICRCEDVPASDLAHFADWRTAKLGTRVGMGACQGRTCGSACQFLFGWEPERSRFPISPATAGSLSQIE